jgi:hypothetical protein
MRKGARGVVLLGLLGAIAYALWRVWQARMPARTGDVEWTTAPFPFPPEPRPVTRSSTEPWVEPNSDGSCPDGYPIKAKLHSGIYHVPGGANYERTHPDRCYADEEAAEKDGLRRSKV